MFRCSLQLKSERSALHIWDWKSWNSKKSHSYQSFQSFVGKPYSENRILGVHSIPNLMKNFPSSQRANWLFYVLLCFYIGSTWEGSAMCHTHTQPLELIHPWFREQRYDLPVTWNSYGNMVFSLLASCIRWTQGFCVCDLWRNMGCAAGIPFWAP